MLPFKPLFFYNISDELQLCEIVDKNGNVMTKVVSNCIMPNSVLDKLERIFEED